jgi:Immunoglobulin-like domain of bacterial spore germination/Sporulation and spore germination
MALVIAAGLVGGSGTAAHASSHNPTPHTSATYSLWFKRSAQLWHTKRTVASAAFPGRTAMRLLLAGPNAAESAAGVKTAIPAGTRLLSFSMDGHTANVNLRRKFTTPAPRRRIRMRLAQVTFTAMQLPGVRSVHIQISGTDVKSIAGVPVPQHMTRATFPRLLPAIVVHKPVIGATVPASALVTGTSDVFEAAMVVKVLNAGGLRIAQKSFLASCGTGCRGHFAVSISYHVASAQDGMIVVSDTSARGGRPLHVVRIPVKLSP